MFKTGQPECHHGSWKISPNVVSRVASNIVILQVVTKPHSGHQGHPRRIINIDYQQEALSNSYHIKLTELMNTQGIHRNMLHTYMKNHGVEWKYALLSNGDLDELVTQFKKEQPDSRIQYLMGFLRQQGVRVLQYH
jgi:hypothetical protein